MLCSLEAQSDIGPNDNDSLARKIDMFHWSYFPPLILDEPEKGELSHNIERSVKGGFTERPQLYRQSTITRGHFIESRSGHSN